MDPHSRPSRDRWPVTREALMNAASACPDSRTLQEYLLGGHSDAAAASLEAHLAECPRCRALLPTFRAEDDFVAAFRAHAGRSLPRNALLDRLAGDLHCLLGTVPSAVEATSAPDGGAEDTDEDVRRLLAPPREPDEMGRLGDYRVLEVLGSGGMGVVFLAEDIHLRRRVALKAMRPTLAASARARQRFLREARLTASLTHDHVVAVHHVGEEQGVPFLAMPLLQGESLETRLKREGRLPLEEVLRIGRETAEGLAAAHEHAMVHRDIKPANIFLEVGSRQLAVGSEERAVGCGQLAVSSEGKDAASSLPTANCLLPTVRVKILDFGLARSGEGEAELTQPGMIMGTPAYMAPEQALGRVDHRADLFSLGCVLYRMATGQAPYAGATPLAVLGNAIRDRPRPPRQCNPEVPAALSDLVMRLLEKDPARRPASATEVVHALQSQEQALPAIRVSGYQQKAASARPGRRRLVMVVGAVVLSAGLVGLGVAALNRIATDRGDYVIETDDADFSFQVHGPAVKLDDRKTGKTYPLRVVHQDRDARDVEMEVEGGGDLVFKTKTFTIKRGEKAAVTAWFERKRDGAPDEWIRQVAALPAEDQVKAVAARLKDLNPGFDGQVKPTFEDGVVTGLNFLTDDVSDISPVRALAGLKILVCGGSPPRKGRLADLSPLKGMPLTQLSCPNSQVSDLRPLEGTQLRSLYLSYTRVSNLAQLNGLRLNSLDFEGTQVSDLEPLRGMPLRYLNCRNTPVTTLEPLARLPLFFVDCRGTRVADLQALSGMSLTTLYYDFNPRLDNEVLRSLKTLQQINGKPAQQFWQEVEPK
jgi:serine/threonine protein kinase